MFFGSWDVSVFFIVVGRERLIGPAGVEDGAVPENGGQQSDWDRG
jgi:hypothetical protein